MRFLNDFVQGQLRRRIMWYSRFVVDTGLPGRYPNRLVLHQERTLAESTVSWGPLYTTNTQMATKSSFSCTLIGIGGSGNPAQPGTKLRSRTRRFGPPVRAGGSTRVHGGSDRDFVTANPHGKTKQSIFRPQIHLDSASYTRCWQNLTQRLVQNLLL